VSTISEIELRSVLQEQSIISELELRSVLAGADDYLGDRTRIEKKNKKNRPGING